MDTENTLEKPEAIVPTEKAISISGNTLEMELAPQSFNVYTIKL
jgi:alpha-L-arabinofuranosidase